MQLDPLGGPPEADSPDLTDEEIARATVTKNGSELGKVLEETLRGLPQLISTKHDLRRRQPHLYYRAHLGFQDGSNKVLVFQVDWLRG
jgi:hypothetical protein